MRQKITVRQWIVFGHLPVPQPKITHLAANLASVLKRFWWTIKQSSCVSYQHKSAFVWRKQTAGLLFRVSVLQKLQQTWVNPHICALNSRLLWKEAQTEWCRVQGNRMFPFEWSRWNTSRPGSLWYWITDKQQYMTQIKKWADFFLKICTGVTLHQAWRVLFLLHFCFILTFCLNHTSKIRKNVKYSA